MKSKIFTRIMTVAAGAALLAGAALPAQAATRELNIYGASAQYTFWSALAKPFLESKGCTVGNDYGATSDKHAFARGTNCTGYKTNGVNDTVIIRYSSKASYDGIFSVKGEAMDPFLSDPDTCGSNYQRKMADELTNNASHVVSGKKCVRVTIGASDVAGESFTQISSGMQKGPLGGAPWGEQSFYDEASDSYGVDTTIPGTTTKLDFKQPIVVPFGFFVNNSVTVRRCTGTTNGAYDGEMCTISGGTTYGCGGSGTCPTSGVTLDNITREMAVNIFSGAAKNWTDFGAGFPASMPIVACMRHAGSGTHATLDYAVVRGNGWGNGLWPYENASNPTVWFNETSGDEMNCVGGSESWAGTGAIGYADADAALVGNAAALKYNGLYGTRTNIRNGMYDFWASQWLYFNQNHPDYSSLHPVYLDMVSYAGDPANLNATTLSSKVKYWATADEMKFKKLTDQAYPAFTGATIPLLP